MIAESIAVVHSIDWSAVTTPGETQEVLERAEVLLKPLRVQSGEYGGEMNLWLLTGSNKETGERLMLEFTKGPFMTEPHGYPSNGAAYGQRVWVLAGELEFICAGSPEPIIPVRAGQMRDHPGGIWHRSFIKYRSILLIHQPHGSLLHPAFRT